MMFVFLVLGMTCFEVFVNLRQAKQDYYREDRSRYRKIIHVRPAGDPDTRDKPYRRRGGQPVNASPVLNDCPSAEETDARNDLRGDSCDRILVARHCFRDYRKCRRPEANQDIRAKPRGFMFNLTLKADDGSASRRKKQT